MFDMETKQIIVFRKDLLKGEHGIRKGKFAGQVVHASLGARWCGIGARTAGHSSAP